MDLSEPLLITTESSSRRRRDSIWIGKDGALSWTIAVAILLINFIAIGLGRMSSILYVDFIREFKVNRKYAAAPFSVQQSTRNLFGPVVGLLGHKFGVRAVTIAGGLIGAVGGTACAYAKDMLWITVFWGALYGIGIAFTSTLGQIILDDYFEKYLSSASGLSFAGGSLGTFIFSFALQKTIDLYGLSNTFVVMGIMTLFVVPLAITLVKPPPWMREEEQEVSSGRERSFVKGRFFVVDSLWPTDSLKKKPMTDAEQTEKQSSVILDKQFGSNNQDKGLSATSSVEGAVELESETLKKTAFANNKSTDKTGNQMTSLIEDTKATFNVSSKNDTPTSDEDSRKEAEVQEDTKIIAKGQRLDIGFKDSNDGSNDTLCSTESESSIYHQASEGLPLSGEKTEKAKITVDDNRCLPKQEVPFTDRASREMFEAEKFMEEGEAFDTSFALASSIKHFPETEKTVSRLESKLESTMDASQDASSTIENSEKPFIVEKYVLKKVKQLEPGMVFTAKKGGILKQTEVIQKMDKSQEKSDKEETRKPEEIEKPVQREHPWENSEDEITFRSRSPMPSPEAVKEFAVKKYIKKKIESAGYNSSSVSGEASNPNYNENKGAKPKIPYAKRSFGGSKKKHHNGKGSQKSKALITNNPRPIIENPSFDVEYGELFTQQKQTGILDSGLASIEESLSPKSPPRDDDPFHLDNLLETYRSSDPAKPSSSEAGNLFIHSIQNLSIDFLRQHIHDVILVLNIKCVVASTGILKLNYGSIWSKDRKFLKELEELFISIERERYDLYLKSHEKSRGALCTMCQNLMCGSFHREDRKNLRRKSSLYPRLQDIFKKSDRYILSHFEGERRPHFKKLICELRALYDYVKEPLTLGSQHISLQQRQQKNSNRCWPPFMHQVIFKLYLNPAFLVICLSRAVHLMTFMGVLTFIVDFALDKGLEENDARYSVTMMSLGDLLGRLCTGWITDTMLISLERYMLLAMVLIGAISVSFPYLPSNSLLPLICLYSILQGSLFIRHPVLVSKYTSSQERTVGMGFMTLFSGLLGLLMPFYIGHYRDEIGSYNHIFFINGGICMAIGLLWVLESRLKKYAHSTDFQILETI